jgi:hypothetical protein
MHWVWGMIMRLLRFLRAITESISQQDTPAVESCLAESPATAHQIQEIQGFWYHPPTDRLHPKDKWTKPNSSHSTAALDDLNIPELQGYEWSAEDDFKVLELAMKHGWVRGVNFDGNIVLQGIDQESATAAWDAVGRYFDDTHVVNVSLVGWTDEFERVIPMKGNE